MAEINTYKIEDYNGYNVLSIIDKSKENILNLINELDIFKIKYDTIIINSVCSEDEKNIYQTIIDNVPHKNLVKMCCVIGITNFDILQNREDYIASHPEVLKDEEYFDVDEEIFDEAYDSWINIVTNQNEYFTYKNIPHRAIACFVKNNFIDKVEYIYSYNEEINFKNVLILDSNYMINNIPRGEKKRHDKVISDNISPLIDIYIYNNLNFIKLIDL